MSLCARLRFANLAMRFAVALWLLGPGAGVARPSGNTCAEQPGLVGPCFSVRGRASFANGNPSVRIWKIGTNRVLGVSESQCQEPECPQMPADLRGRLDWDHAIFADFVVCPFTKSAPGHMQLVCVESASRVEVRKLK